MSDIMIRPCTMCDTEDICRLSREALGYDFTLEQTAEKLCKALERSSDLILIAEYSGEVAGYIHACDYDLLYFPHMKNIMGIAVYEKFRRRGVGTALLSAVEAWARETGAEAVRLSSGESRASAHEFYKTIGYSCGSKQLNFRKTV